MEKMRFESPDMVQKNIEKIAALFPNCVTETSDGKGGAKKAVDFDKLKQMLDTQEVAWGGESYEFTWVGKRASLLEARKPIRKTLRPCREESVSWDATENLYIEGDNLDVLKLLQESYLGKVKMIYIDPPYNTGNDFVYNDNFVRSQKDEDEQAGLFNEEGKRLFKNTNNRGRFHSDWCSMIYPRLMLARNMLTDDGVIFISIDDNEQENLKKICDEVFGASNFITNFIWQSTPGSNTGLGVKTVTEYVLLYSKNVEFLNIMGLDANLEKYDYEDSHVAKRGKYILNKLDRRMTGIHYSDSLNYPIKFPSGSEIYPGSAKTKQANWNWRWSKEKVKWGIENDFIVFRENGRSSSIYFKQYQLVDNNDEIISRKIPVQNLLKDKSMNSARGTSEVIRLLNLKVFDYPKPLSLLAFLLKISTEGDDLVFDFFSGSATTAHAVMQLNAEDGGHRKFIMVQLPEPCDEKSEAFKAGYKNICEIGKERIRRAAKKIKEENPGATFDGGFRVLKVDDTNMRDVYYGVGEYNQKMLSGLVGNIKEDRTDLDLLFSCVLEWGLPLSMPHTSEEIDGCVVHTYNGGDLVACFDKDVPDSVIRAIARKKPLRAVFRDSGFVDSPAKINVDEIFKLLAPETRVKVI